MRRLAVPALMAAAALAACDEVPSTGVYAPPPAAVPAPPPVAVPPPDPGPPLDARSAARNFVSVVRRMEPVIEAECRSRTVGVNCDYRILVDDRPDQQANAYQTLSATGQPVIAFTIPLIAEARNVDELAFIMGHEASHHILRHIPQQQQSSELGATLGGIVAQITGADAATVRQVQSLGATFGARQFSKQHELEADQLGTVIAYDAGYDPLLGSQFFNRLPDPGNQFLGSHPPNADRLLTVQTTMAALRAGAGG